MKIGPMRHYIFGALCVLLSSTPLAAAEEPVRPIPERARNAAIFLDTLLNDDRWAGVQNLLGAAKAVVVVPEIKKAAFVIGYEHGVGIMLRRHGEVWSDPIAISMSAASFAFQAGVQQSDLVMVIMTNRAVDELLQGIYKVGGSGGFALGNLGVSGRASGGVSGGLEVLTLSLNAGLFLGGGFEGMSIQTDDAINAKVYGSRTPAEVLSTPGGTLAEAEELRAKLADAVRRSWWD